MNTRSSFLLASILTCGLADQACAQAHIDATYRLDGLTHTVSYTGDVGLVHDLGILGYGTKSSAESRAETQIGLLRAYARVNSDTGGSPAQASCGVDISDEVTITSSTLPIGTPVNIEFDFALHGVISTTFYNPSYPRVDYGDFYGDLKVQGLGDVHQDNWQTGQSTLSETLAAKVGSRYSLFYELTAAAVLATGQDGKALETNAWNTADLYAVPDVGGVQVVSTSGDVYRSSPVPEPTSISAFGLGFIFLFRRKNFVAEPADR